MAVADAKPYQTQDHDCSYTDSTHTDKLCRIKVSTIRSRNHTSHCNCTSKLHTSGHVISLLVLRTPKSGWPYLRNKNVRTYAYYTCIRSTNNGLGGGAAKSLLHEYAISLRMRVLRSTRLQLPAQVEQFVSMDRLTPYDGSTRLDRPASASAQDLKLVKSLHAVSFMQKYKIYIHDCRW